LLNLKAFSSGPCLSTETGIRGMPTLVTLLLKQALGWWHLDRAAGVHLVCVRCKKQSLFRQNS